jgi:hypothetical protein
MDREAKRSGSISSLLVGLILLLTVAGLILSVVPLARCPSCGGHQKGFVLKNGSRIEMAEIVDVGTDYVFFKSRDGSRVRVAVADISGSWGCDYCGGRKRVSILKRLRSP